MIIDPVHRSAALRSVARRATLGRSLGLLRSFPQEQSDPDAFYSGLARDTVELVSDLWEQAGDGGGPESAGQGAAGQGAAGQGVTIQGVTTEGAAGQGAAGRCRA